MSLASQEIGPARGLHQRPFSESMYTLGPLARHVSWHDIDLTFGRL
jgi:hypothetical protein